jgi:AcrR family transcriptional regulator
MNNQQRRALSIEKILAASLQELQMVGYHGLRTVAVARRAGLSEGTLFRYFPTKVDLTVASLDRALISQLQQLQVAYSNMAKPIIRSAMLEVLWGVLAQKELLWTHELIAALSTDEQLRSVIAPCLLAHDQRIDAGLVPAMEVFGIPAKHAKLAASVVRWSMRGFVLRDITEGFSGGHHRLLSFLDAIADRVYGAQPDIISNP